MSRDNDSYTVTELQGTVRQWRQYMEDELGFDTGIQASISVKNEMFHADLNGDDLFQAKRSYNERVADVRIWEAEDQLEDLIAQVWEKLRHHMRRDERELRFGLAQLGDTLEGDQFNTEIGRMIAARIRAVRDEVSSLYLPRFESRNETSRDETVAVPKPKKPEPDADDDIPF